ncbi:Uma2 family endonuclease [Streptomyces sp. NA04227]|uniref:Uma2 family endonuclease n=1 Tax=Streptomyces sp. NA04227 TaxID=2742136 RepID=UPI0015912A1F|nr:Uma2 family endonuclease [Streptomyces sp. NA04227]QKW08524.1 Uma2 family endonuclease [Streptomyces sp. NA04227]
MSSFYERHRDLIEEVQRLTPLGFRVEWSGDTIIMQAQPSGIHQGNVRKIREQFDAHRPARTVPNEGAELTSPTIDKGRVPDLCYLPEETELSGENSFPADLAFIVIELVSPTNPENDWVGKLRDYAAMHIPLYLIVDSRDSTVTLFSDPDHDRYQTRTDRKFGDSIRIPEPFGFELDLSSLNPYS